jgi:hypothetical protein
LKSQRYSFHFEYFDRPRRIQQQQKTAAAEFATFLLKTEMGQAEEGENRFPKIASGQRRGESSFSFSLNTGYSRTVVLGS